MQGYLEQIATAVSALTGVLAARGKQVDLFGVIVLALVTALGGGTVRDLILDAHPVFWAENPAFIVTAFIAGIVVFPIARIIDLSGKFLLIADAGGLALFTIAGAAKSLDYGTHPIVAIVLGVITGVTGGMIRDVLTGEIPMVFRKQIYLYATAAFFGSIIFVLCSPFLSPPVVQLAGILTVFLLRICAIQWRLRLPVFKTKFSGHPGEEAHHE